MQAMSRCTRPDLNALPPGTTPCPWLRKSARRCCQSKGYKSWRLACAAAAALSWLHRSIAKRVALTMCSPVNAATHPRWVSAVKGATVALASARGGSGGEAGAFLKSVSNARPGCTTGKSDGLALRNRGVTPPNHTPLARATAIGVQVAQGRGLHEVPHLLRHDCIMPSNVFMATSSAFCMHRVMRKYRVRKALISYGGAARSGWASAAQRCPWIGTGPPSNIAVATAGCSMTCG